MSRMSAEYKRAYYAANRERICAQNEAWRQRNREQSNAAQRRRAASNRKAVREWKREHYAKNREALKAQRSAWLAVNPDKAFLYYAKRKISHSCGVAFALVPDALAEAKAAQLKVVRAASVGRNPKGENTEECLSAKHEHAVGEAETPKTNDE